MSEHQFSPEWCKAAADEIERLRARVEWFEKSGGVTVHTLVHKQRIQLAACQALLREAVEYAIDDSPSNSADEEWWFPELVPAEWFRAAREAAGGGE